MASSRNGHLKAESSPKKTKQKTPHYRRHQMETCALRAACVTLYPWMSPFWVSRGGVSQLTSREVGDAAATLMDWGATEGAAQEERLSL